MKNDSTAKVELEKKYHTYISQLLQNKQFKEIKVLIEKSIELDIHIDPRKIPNRFKIISDLLIESIRTLNLGEIFEILRLINHYNIIYKDLSDSDIEIVENVKNDQLFITNIIDLFGNVSNSFILYIKQEMPSNLYEFYCKYFNEYSLYSNENYDVNIILNYLNEYSIYGLSVKLLGKVKDFVKLFSEKFKDHKKAFIEFTFANKKHLVSSKNILENFKYPIMLEDYDFYNLSMVILYGIGPQGFGFTFSTPKGEVVEICSDVKENEAIIIKYKQFLTEQFIFKLEKELIELNIKSVIIEKLNSYLLNLLKPKNLINYYKKDEIVQKIKQFFESELITSFNSKDHFQKFINKIIRRITNILRPIKMVDQFKARMDLVADGKLRSEDIAKLTSLKEKSHYDVLRERFFLQYIVKWFYEIYLEKNSQKIKN